MQKVHFRLMCVAEKRLCLSSLTSRTNTIITPNETSLKKRRFSAGFKIIFINYICLLFPFLLNCCPQYRSFISRLQVQLPNTRWPGSGSMQPLCTAPLGTWNFRKFLTGIFVMERRSLIPTRIPHLLAFLADIVVVVTLP